jgi:hypothetical protein
MSTLSLPIDRGSTTAVVAEALPLWRLYLMRGLYLLIALGMGSIIWPQIISHPLSMHSAAPSLLGALTLLCLLGVRYPVQMLPLLLFELVWKTIWLVSVAYPAWMAGPLDADMWESTRACLMGVIVPLVIPWRYVFAHYVKARGDRWR